MDKREVITGKPKAWVTRGNDGKFKNWTNRSKSMKIDRRIKAKKTVKSGYGNMGDQKPHSQKKNSAIFNWLKTKNI